jgi:hypothetical protein
VPFPFAPEAGGYFLVGQFIVNSIGTHHNKIMLFIVYFEIGDLWLGDQHLRITAIGCKLGLNITERARN